MVRKTDYGNKWHDNGQLKLKVKFKNGIKIGEEFYWNSDGTVRYKDFYINGKIKKIKGTLND